MHQCPITFGYSCGIIAMIIISLLGILPPISLVYYKKAVFHDFELWRLVTGLFYFGKPDFMMLISLAFRIKFMHTLETTVYNQRKSTFLFIILLMIIPVYILSDVFGSFSSALSLSEAIEMLAGKLMQANMLIFGIIPIPIRFVPIFQIFMSVVQNQSPIPIIIGILSGHLVFYLLYVFPVITKTPIFRTPNFLRQLLD